jgi:hypothetical protein
LFSEVLIFKHHNYGTAMSSDQNRKEWQTLLYDVQTFLRWAISSVLDAIFLVAWVFIQWIASNMIFGLELSGLDRVVFFVFQVLFAASTLTPVATHTYINIVRMFKRARQEAAMEIIDEHKNIKVTDIGSESSINKHES